MRVDYDNHLETIVGISSFVLRSPTFLTLSRKLLTSTAGSSELLASPPYRILFDDIRAP
jgi:hypothetical protein